jgi:hypothetical protein
MVPILTFRLGRAYSTWRDLQLEELAPLSATIWPHGTVHGEDPHCTREILHRPEWTYHTVPRIVPCAGKLYPQLLLPGRPNAASKFDE